MMYEKMSDFEINKLVADKLGLTLCPDDKQKPETAIVLTEEYYSLKGTIPQIEYHAWDYCHIVSHAWPIIQEIWWELFEVEDYGTVKWNRYFTSEEDESTRLRAAMVIYLKTNTLEK